MEYVGGTSQYLLSAQSLDHSARVLATARRILKCFRVVDLGYFITGLALTVTSVTDSEETLRQDFDNLLYGSVLLVFSVLSALCNALGVRALDREARGLLVPWLVLYPWVIVSLLAGVLHTLWVTDFHLELYQVSHSKNKISKNQICSIFRFSYLLLCLAYSRAGSMCIGYSCC